MKRVYLVDSENVGDVWVPLLASSMPDEEVLVFYTQQSPHMGYENVRILKETEKNPVFIKCFEGRNALDFQLVTELGYRLHEDEECEYVIISTDNGFDAAVRYWTSQKKKVRRLNGKECFKYATGQIRHHGEKNTRVTEQVWEKPIQETPIQEAPAEAAVTELPQDTVVVAEVTEAAAETTKTAAESAETESLQENTAEEPASEQLTKSKSGARRRRRRDTKKQKTETAEAVQEEMISEEDAIRETTEEETVDIQPEIPEEVQTEVPEDIKTEVETVVETEAETVVETETETEVETKVESEEVEQLSETEIISQPEAIPSTKSTETPEEVEAIEPEAEAAVPETDDTEWIVTNLFRCIQKDNLADFHNAMVMFLGEEEGKRLYQEAKSSDECNAFWAEQSGNSQIERFDIYCRMVFVHSESAEDFPEDFAEFLWKAEGKRNNLNSLRAALQSKYGKDKGMKYYSLIKSHIKIMNRM